MLGCASDVAPAFYPWTSVATPAAKEKTLTGRHNFFLLLQSPLFFFCGIRAWMSPSGVFSGAGPWNVCLSGTCHLHGKGKRRSGLWLFVFWCRMRSLPNSKHTVTVIQIHWHNFRTYGTPEKSSVEVSKYQHDPELMAWSIHFLLPSWTWGLSN